MQETARYRRLDQLDQIYHGDQYKRQAGLAPPWDKQPQGAPRTPLRLQRPAVQYAVSKVIVDRPTALLFGEHRFPKVVWEPRQKAGPTGEGAVVDGADVTQWITNIIDEGHLAAVALTWARLGGALGTAILTWALVEGRFEFTPHKAQHCDPVFDPRSTGPLRRLLQLEKRYKFNKAVKEIVGGVLTVRDVEHWHRELWTPMQHLVYRDEPVHGGIEPTWTVDAQTDHNFGIVPGVWVKNLDDGDPGSIDGCSLMNGVEPLLEDVDRALTGLARGVRYNTEPEKVYTGIPIDPATKKPIDIAGGASTSIPAGGDAKLLEITGKGLEVASAHVQAERGRALEVARVVTPDPERLLAAAKSGAALRILFAPMLDLVGELRQSYGAGLRGVLQQIVALAREGKLRALGTLETEPPATIPDGKIVLQWGVEFQPTPEDLQARATTASVLKTAGLLTQETLVRFLAEDFGVRDVMAELEGMEEEQARAMESMNAALVDPEADDAGAADGAGAKPAPKKAKGKATAKGGGADSGGAREAAK